MIGPTKFEDILPRAWELAEMIMQAPRSTRHLKKSLKVNGYTKQ